MPDATSSTSTPEASEQLTIGGILMKLLRSVLIAYLLVLILLTFVQRHLLYHPRKADSLPVAEFPDVTRSFPAAEDVEATTASGVKLRGWLLRKTPEELPTRPLAIFFHGNAGNRAGRSSWYQLFGELGIDVLAMDYPGYGDSEGSMTESGLEETCDVAWKIATDRGWQPSRILIAGSSLGGAAAVHLSSVQCQNGNEPLGLCVVATFSSMTDVAASLYPWLPVRAVLVDRYPSEDKIGDVTCPIAILHGDQDELVFQEFGRKLFQSAPKHSSSGIPAKWVNMADVTHRNTLSGGQSLIRAEIRRLLDVVSEPAR